MQWPQIEHAWVYIVIALVLLYALGVWLGAKGKVVIYRNYYDVILLHSAGADDARFYPAGRRQRGRERADCRLIYRDAGAGGLTAAYPGSHCAG